MCMFKTKEGEYLTPEQIQRYCIKKCKKHNVEFDFCYKRMRMLQLTSVTEFVLAFDDLLFWAYFHDYDNLFPHRKEYRKDKKEAS